MTVVHQVLSSAGPYDAVSGQALAWRELLERRGLAGGVYAESIDPRAGRPFEPVADLDPEPEDVLAIRHSAFAPQLRRVLELPQRKLLIHHNVTPPRYLWRHHAGVAMACALGRSQLPRWAGAVDVAVADSEFNAAELRAAGAEEVRVVPILMDAARLESRGEAPGGGGDPLVLVVGRLAPNKRHDLVLRAFAAYQRECAPDAGLLCVGEPLSPAYRELVERLAADSGARNVTVAGGLPQADLNAAYAAADVMLSMSEHEGFCVPLLEAFHFGLPVVARPAGGMPEVGGEAVLWTEERRDGETGEVDTAVAAELIDLAVRDGELRVQLVERGRERLAEYSYEGTAAKVDAAVDAALGGVSGAARADGSGPSPSSAAPRRSPA